MIKLNDYTGKYDSTIEEVKITKTHCHGNWIEGTIDGHWFQAKVFATPSVFGIYHGRISKLSICKGDEWNSNNCIYHYDRGHDFSTNEGKRLARKLLKVFPKSKGV